MKRMEGNSARVNSQTTRVELLTPEAYAPYGWVIGEAASSTDLRDMFHSDTLEFWHEHDFDPGAGGRLELIWVYYRRKPLRVENLESHRLTEQAIIPVAGANPIVHVVCPPPPDPTADRITPDLNRMKAFLLDGTRGVCMRPGTWHTHFALGREANYLMLTRRSTTVEILQESAYLAHEVHLAEADEVRLAETEFADIPELIGSPIELVL
jgi:ureidoglycolate lyase